MSVRLQQKELEMVNEENDKFNELNVNTYHAQRESSAAISKRE